jgi:forespore regulator of the sigma-K checkpoint
MPTLLKRFKRMLRRYRGLAALGGLIIAVLGVLLYNNLAEKRTLESSKERSFSEIKAEETIDVMANQPVKLILKTSYLCGTETITKEFKEVSEIEDWLVKHREPWVLKEKNDREFIMVREVSDDLSPLCKKEGYFGIAKDGTLAIFLGPPNDNQVIQTFFRMDTELLESRLPKTEMSYLKDGIKINTVTEYFSILSTYGEFAVEY